MGLHPGARALVFAKIVVFMACAMPGALLVRGALLNELGANPLEALIHGTGLWALRMLLLTLAITPLRRLTGWQWLQRFRRMLGLFAFAYATLHFRVWLALYKGFSWAAIVEDIGERPFITVGFLAFVLLLPLAVTSTRGMMRRLGRRWQPLHRLVYPVAVLGVIHFVWLVKADWLEPAVYGAILALLLALRLPTVREALAGRRGRGVKPA